MKKVQFTLLFSVIIFLIAYTTYVKLSEKFDFSYEHNDRYQFYINEEKIVVIPKSVFFAGEKIPLDNKKVASKLQREIQILSYWNNSSVLLLQRANYWLPQIRPILKQYGVPDDFKYLAVVESKLMNVESPQQAGGFWQILPSTGRHYGLEINDEVDERYHPIKATHAACRYFKESHRIFGNWTSVAASYNAGMGRVLQAMKRQQHKSYYKLKLNDETSRYIYRASALKQLIEQPKKFGYRKASYRMFNKSLRRVKVTESIENLSEFAHKNGITLSLLKHHNPWILSNRLTIKAPQKTYILQLPEPMKKVEQLVKEVTTSTDSLPN